MASSAAPTWTALALAFMGRPKRSKATEAAALSETSKAASKRGDLHALDLAIKFFNTFMRAAINKKDIRTAYNILHQYRQLAEVVLMHANHPAMAVGDQAPELEQRTVDIARFMRYYSATVFQGGMAFITEVIAHDIGAICAHAFRLGARCHDGRCPQGDMGASPGRRARARAEQIGACTDQAGRSPEAGGSHPTRHRNHRVGS